jgi:DNA primase
VDQDAALSLGKWKLPRGIPKADLLFNWHRARPYVDHGVVLVEGPFDAMRLWQVGVRSVVALLGTNLSPAQRTIVTSTRRAVLMLDGDEAGRDGANRIASALAPQPVHVVELPQGRDPADLDENELLGVVASFFP